MLHSEISMHHFKSSKNFFFYVGSGNKTAIVTNTTVEIVVPDDVISLVYGENGTNLTRLRQVKSMLQVWVS